MWKDPIVEEIHQIREKHAAQFDFDLDAICDDLKRFVEESGLEVVSLPPKSARQTVHKTTKEIVEAEFPSPES